MSLSLFPPTLSLSHTLNTFSTTYSTRNLDSKLIAVASPSNVYVYDLISNQASGAKSAGGEETKVCISSACDLLFVVVSILLRSVSSFTTHSFV